MEDGEVVMRNAWVLIVAVMAVVGVGGTVRGEKSIFDFTESGDFVDPGEGARAGDKPTEKVPEKAPEKVPGTAENRKPSAPVPAIPEAKGVSTALTRPAGESAKPVAWPAAGEIQKAMVIVRATYDKLLERDLKYSSLFARRNTFRRMRLEVNRSTDAAERAALLLRMREFAVQAGDAWCGTRTLVLVELSFKVDVIPLYEEDIQAMLPAVKLDEQRADMQFMIRRGMYQALAKEDFLAYPSLALVGLREARKLPDQRYLKAMEKLVAKCRDTQSAYERAEKAKTELAANPESASANMARGEYLCFFRQEWKVGLPFFVKSGDARLKPLAELTLTDPASAEECLRIADGWWAVAQTLPPVAMNNVRLFSNRWYERAEETATGQTLERIQRHLEDWKKEIAKTVADLPPPAGTPLKKTP